jgi:hypothetical protein
VNLTIHKGYFFFLSRSIVSMNKDVKIFLLVFCCLFHSQIRKLFTYCFHSMDLTIILVCYTYFSNLWNGLKDSRKFSEVFIVPIHHLFSLVTQSMHMSMKGGLLYSLILRSVVKGIRKNLDFNL